MNYINTFFDDVFRLLYPRSCSGCGSDLVSAGHVVCAACLDEMPVTDFSAHKENPVEKIFRGRLQIVTASAYAYFTKDSIVQNLLHDLKYKANKDVGQFMGKAIGKSLHSCSWYNDLEIVIPLPLHFSKEKKRGYNQTSVIARGIAEILKIPVLEDVIIRTRKTDTQTRKSRTERWNNIHSKFELRQSESIKGKHVLLVDDVITTGATLEACGMELIKTAELHLSIAAFAYTSL